MAISDDTAELTAKDLPELLKDDQSVKVAACDIDGILRGKLMSKKKFLSVAESGFGFCSVVFGWDMHDQTYFRELKVSNKENGYRDLIAEVDLSSFRRIPWEDNVPFFLCSFREPDGTSLSACPRSLLERVCDKIEKAGMGALAGGDFILSDGVGAYETDRRQRSTNSINSEYRKITAYPSPNAILQTLQPFSKSIHQATCHL